MYDWLIIVLSQCYRYKKTSDYKNTNKKLQKYGK